MPKLKVQRGARGAPKGRKAPTAPREVDTKPKLISRRCEGVPASYELPNLTKWFLADYAMFAKRPRAEILRVAFGYVVHYPQLLEWVGHEWLGERYDAKHALDMAHREAVKILMAEAEARGIDSGSLWDYGRVCREIFSSALRVLLMSLKVPLTAPVQTGMVIPHVIRIGLPYG
jgi:hypothetical protein